MIRYYFGGAEIACPESVYQDHDLLVLSANYSLGPFGKTCWCLLSRTKTDTLTEYVHMLLLLVERSSLPSNTTSLARTALRALQEQPIVKLNTELD